MTGKRLRALRQSRKWTQTKMADKLGVHYRTIGKWESEQEVSQPNLLHFQFGIRNGNQNTA